MQPPTNRGLKILSKELFNLQRKTGALIVPVKSCKRAAELRQNGLLKLPRFPSILPVPLEYDNASQKRMVLLDPEVDCSSLDKLPQQLKEFAQEVGAELTTYTLTLDYDYWSTEEILKSILPPELEVPSSFATVGHIAHFNLRKEYDEYKKVIGEVILTKAKNITTVVNKTDNIDHTFRFFKMELLAGVEDMNAQVKESNCTFKFDFSKVYWNSRLQGEHDRLVKLFKKGDIICDVFGGVGPFALPAATNAKAFVLCNDLNPESFKYLQENIKLNKVADKVAAYNLDGREFIKKSLELVNDHNIWNKFRLQQAQYAKLRRKVDKKTPEDPIPESDFIVPDHYIMNLPATALDFLDAFVGLFSGKSEVSKMPMIHCYCFSKKEDPNTDILAKVESVVGKVDAQIHKVRNVAPKKDMFCVSFRLPETVAFSLKRKSE